MEESELGSMNGVEGDSGLCGSEQLPVEICLLSVREKDFDSEDRVERDRDRDDKEREVSLSVVELCCIPVELNGDGGGVTRGVDW